MPLCHRFVLFSLLSLTAIVVTSRADDCPCPGKWYYGGKKQYGCIDWGSDLNPGSAPGGVFWCTTAFDTSPEKGHVFGSKFHICDEGSPCKIRSFDAGSLSDCEKICFASGIKTQNGVAYLDDEATCICGPLGQLFD